MSKAKELVDQMTLEEKASLCSGLDFWHMKGVERLGLPSLMVTDGPHGLRKQAGDADHLGINESVPATCFPTASATAGSFDTELMREIGVALGEECQQEDVAVLLGPGANIKRSPLCGRNFEYISEDPYVTGEMAAALIAGVQSQGVGTSMKHFAANNQEWCRMTGNSVVDERALREIYLSGFEKAVKQSQPWTLMCSYNRLNGTYASENKWLLTDVLRDEWGFAGAVMTDWGATNERVAGVKAGLDLEMPSSDGYNDAEIVAAVKAGELQEEQLDKVVIRVVELIEKARDARRQGFRYDAEAHHALARKAAARSCVLLENKDHILPLDQERSVAVIGQFAKTPRYQGAGSSKINPIRIDNACDALNEAGIAYSYAEGYSLERGAQPDEAKIQEACKAAAGKDVVLLFAGLPDEYESEGFDRDTLAMPDAHNQLIEAVAAVNPNVVVVLQLGAPVVMPWADRVKGILVSYLGGQAGGSGCVDVLTGKENPSGRLAETWPEQLADTPAYAYFPGGTKSVQYRESIYVGYHYYDKVGKSVAYPFGYGLSYTDFEYSDLQISETAVRVTVKNTGRVKGAEVVQLYIGREQGKVFRARRELKGFCKVYLEPGESREVEMKLDQRSFAYYNTAVHDWATEAGSYTIEVGASSRDIRLSGSIQVSGDGLEEKLAGLPEAAPVYFNLPGGELAVPEKDFTALYGKSLPPLERPQGQPFDQNSTLNDLKETKIGQQMLKQMQEQAGDMVGGMGEDMDAMVDAMMMHMPLRAMMMMGGDAMTPKMMQGMIDMANGKMVSGMFKLWRGRPKKK